MESCFDYYHCYFESVTDIDECDLIDHLNYDTVDHKTNCDDQLFMICDFLIRRTTWKN